MNALSETFLDLLFDYLGACLGIDVGGKTPAIDLNLAKHSVIP